MLSAAASDTHATHRSASEGFKILVIDDEPEIELLARRCLAHQPGAGQFGLILTDLHLPGADGLGVLQAARCSRHRS